MLNIKPLTAPTSLLAAGALAALLPGLAHAQATTDFLIQEVCLDQYEVVTDADPYEADPVDCASTRKLLPGEPLPYHKIGYAGEQISDSFPIAGDGASSTVSAQSLFFLHPDDPLFDDVAHFKPAIDGYTIMGANESYTFFRGTFGPGGGWQPFWTEECKAEGWLLFPNSSAAYTPGSDDSPTNAFPSCVTSPTPYMNPTTVAWVFDDDFEFSTDKVIDTMIVSHLAVGESHSAMEKFYFTKIYGATRWEAWDTNEPPNEYYWPIAHAQCPDLTETAVFNSVTYYLQNCHDWTDIIVPANPWDPNGVSGIDSTVPAFPIDPLYTTKNLVVNAQFAEPNQLDNDSNANCDLTGWQRYYAMVALDWAYSGSYPPLTDGGNCALLFGFGSNTYEGQQLYQRIDLGAEEGAATFGATMWAPGLGAEESITAHVSVYQYDDYSYRTFDTMAVTITNEPRVFREALDIEEGTTFLYFVVQPLDGWDIYAMQGAFVGVDPPTP